MCNFCSVFLPDNSNIITKIYLMICIKINKILTSQSILSLFSKLIKFYPFKKSIKDSVILKYF